MAFQFKLTRQAGKIVDFSGWEFPALSTLTDRIKEVVTRTMEDNLDVVFSEDGIECESWITQASEKDETLIVNIDMSISGDIFARYSSPLHEFIHDSLLYERSTAARQLRKIADELEQEGDD